MTTLSDLSNQIPPPIRLRVAYAKDPAKVGFFWAESAQKKGEALTTRRNAPATFEAVYQGRPGQREGSIFLASDLDNFFDLGNPPLPLQHGIRSQQVAAFASKAHCIVQSWDTAFSSSSQAAHTACVTALLVPCVKYHCGEDEAVFGPCDFHFDVIILDVFRERLDWGGLTSALKKLYNRWMPVQVLIENKASGISLIQSLRGSGIPITETKADESKGARAINSVGLKSAGSAQGWFRQHRVLVPGGPFSLSVAPWLPGWRTEMRDFSGEDDTSSDRVDATVHLIRQAIVLGSQSVMLPTDWSPECSAYPAAVVDAQQTADLLDMNDPRAEMLAVIGILPDIGEDYAFGTCGTCVNYSQVGYCSFHKRKVISLDSCEFYKNLQDARAESATVQSAEKAFAGRTGEFPKVWR